MQKVTVYHYSKCSTCREALKALRSKGYQLELIEIFDQPPNEKELAELIRKSGLPAQKFMNTSGEVYKEMALKDKVKTMSDVDKVKLMSANGRLIKRPIVTDGSKVTVGFREEPFNQTWS